MITSNICTAIETEVQDCAFFMKILYKQSSINWWKAFCGIVACDMWRLDLVTCIVSSHAMVLNLTLCLQLPYMCKIQELQFTGHCIHIIFGADLHVFCLTAFHF